MADAEKPELTALTVSLLSAYVSNNSVASENLADLIKSTHAALTGLDAPEIVVPAELEHKPAVTVRKSLSSQDHILSLIDGKPYRMLKRHLKGHGLTPAEYRERYGLPRDYPMVAPTYAAQRREVAAKIGLGRRPITKAAAPAPHIEAPAEQAAAASTPANTTPAKKTATAKPARIPRKAPAAKAKTAPDEAVVRSKAGAARKKAPTTAAVPVETAPAEIAASAPPPKAKRAKLAIAVGDGSKAAHTPRKPRSGNGTLSKA